MKPFASHADRFAVSLPISLYESIQIGEMTDKNGELYHIFLGLDRKLAETVKERSLDEADTDLQQYTSDRKRFGEGSYEIWYGKKRTPFALVHATTNDLAGLVWLGPKALGYKSLKHLTNQEIEAERDIKTGEWHTVVYRSYPKFRGKGLMKHFTRFAMEMYLQHTPDAKLWVGFHADNSASQGLVSSLGFELCEEACDREAKWLVMIKK